MTLDPPGDTSARPSPLAPYAAALLAGDDRADRIVARWRSRRAGSVRSSELHLDTGSSAAAERSDPPTPTRPSSNGSRSGHSDNDPVERGDESGGDNGSRATGTGVDVGGLRVPDQG